MSKKGENIYKRKDGRWEGRFIKNHNANGKAVYGYVYAKTYRDVKIKLSDTIQKHNSLINGNTFVSQIKFENLVRDWLNLKESLIKETSYVKYRNLISKYVIPYLGNYSVSELTDEKIEIFCMKLMNEGGNMHTGLSSKTISDILSVIRNVLQYAVHNGSSILTDAKSISIKKTTKEMRILSEMEQKTIYDYICNMPNNKNLGILICLFTGIRVGELCALKWEDISLSEKTIYIHQTMQRIQNFDNDINNKTRIVITSPKSKCSIRTIPLPSEIAKIISQSQTSQRGFFLTGDNKHWVEPRAMQYHFKKLLQNCNIVTTNYHSLRHTFATRCIEVGFDVKSLSEILGHANVNITMNRYVHPSIDLKRKNMERLSAILDVK